MNTLLPEPLLPSPESAVLTQAQLDAVDETWEWLDEPIAVLPAPRPRILVADVEACEPC